MINDPYEDRLRDRCPICGSQRGQAWCTGAATVPLAYPPVDLADALIATPGGPLRRYTVTAAPGVTTVQQLNAADAARLGVAAVLIDEPGVTQL